MQFEYTEPQTEWERMFGGHFCINAFGKINAGDGTRFRSFLEKNQPPPRTPVYINSTGGDVDAAIEIGRLVRDRWFSTDVGTYILDTQGDAEFVLPRKMVAGKCLSAATLIYLGGRLRYLQDEDEFGVHRFSMKDPSPDNMARSQELSAKISAYISDMGIQSSFLSLSASIDAETIQLVSRTELEAMGVVTGGMTEVTWTTQSRNGSIYVRGERDSLFGHQKVMLGRMKDLGFYFHAVVESQGREKELVNFGLVEIVINGEDERIDISARCHRAVLGIYTNIYCQVSDTEAARLSTSESFGVQVRFSAEAGTFLGISAMDTTAGSDQLQTLVSLF